MHAMQRPLILVVEDHREIADVLQAYLRREGMDCLWAEDGEQALRLHQLNKPDLVILDAMLPLLSGPQVLAEIRRRGDTPVMMATAVGDDVENDYGGATAAGLSAVLFDPAGGNPRVERSVRTLRQLTG